MTNAACLPVVTIVVNWRALEQIRRASLIRYLGANKCLLSKTLVMKPLLKRSHAACPLVRVCGGRI
jgi:hypothetical protein